ncbi:MAG: extracellular solute-binding protein, partial [bacterium]
MIGRVALVALALWARVAPAAGPPRVHLSVSDLILPRDDDMGINGQAQRAVLAAFRARHPDIEVVRFGGISIQNIGIDVGPLIAIAAGIAPAVLYVNFRKSDSYIQQGFLAPLDPYVATMPRTELEETVPGPVREVLHRPGPDGHAHWWALPYGHLVMALTWRKDLFQEAGLDPERAPRNWDELLDYARRITNPAKGIYGMGFGSGPDASWHFYSFLLSAGARAVAQDANGQWRAAFDSPEATEAAYFYSRIIQQKYVKNGRTIPGAALRDPDIYTMWDQGKLGMFQDYLDNKLISQVNPELIGIAPVPLGPSGKRGSEVNSTCMGLSAGTKDPAVRQAAWEFMRFWCGPEAVRLRTRVFIENGFGRFLNPVYLRKFGFTEYLKHVPKGWEAVFNQAMRDGGWFIGEIGKKFTINKVGVDLSNRMDAYSRLQELEGQTKPSKMGAEAMRLIAQYGDRTRLETVNAIALTAGFKALDATDQEKVTRAIMD